MGENRNVYGLVVGNPEGKRKLGRLRWRWRVNIKMGLLEIGLGGLGWICLTQDRYNCRDLQNAVMNIRVP
jgi:hypothetical protein